MKENFKKASLFAVVVAILFILTPFIFYSNSFVRAESNRREVFYGAGGIQDFALYNALVQIKKVNGNYGEEEKISLYSDDFNGYVSLDLSNKSINNISGLEKFSFEQLKSIDLSSNNISEITIPNELGGVRSIDVSNNMIAKINISNCRNLLELNANENFIKEINLSSIYNTNISHYVKINLADNLINNVEDITLPDASTKNVTLNVNYNCIDDIVETENMKVLCNFSLPKGVKFKRNEATKLGNNFEFSFKNLQRLDENTSIRLVDKDGKIVLSGNESKLLTFNSYKIEYFDKSTNNTILNNPLYVGFNFDIAPKTPTLIFKDKKGIKIDNLKKDILAPVKIEVQVEEENAKVFYRIDTGSFQELESGQTSFEIKKRGISIVTIYVEIDGIKSEVLSRTINLVASTNKGVYYFSLLFLFILVVLGAVFIIWANKNGYSRREIKERKRARKQAKKENKQEKKGEKNEKTDI